MAEDMPLWKYNGSPIPFHIWTSFLCLVEKERLLEDHVPHSIWSIRVVHLCRGQDAASPINEGSVDRLGYPISFQVVLSSAGGNFGGA